MADPNQASVILNADVRINESQLQAAFNRVEKNLKFNLPLGTVSRDINQFNRSLDSANQRVITFGASLAVLAASIKVFKDIVSSSIEVENAFRDINSVFQLSAQNLDKFSKGLFDVARNTSQSFNTAAEAAKEFSRQGLSSEETLKRTRDALILTRLTSLDAAQAVNVLTASVNGFQKSGLTTTDILNKLATVDQSFAVSSKDLAEGISRAGAAASDAGVSFDQLIGLITAAQQTTARGGAVIGNALKTIFTRLGRSNVLDEFEALGVKIKDVQGNILPTIQLLQNFATTYDHLSGSIKKQAAELVGGVYQINILKATLQDLAKANGIYAQSTEISAQATDQALKRNEALNKSFASLLEQVTTTNKQIFSNIGNQSFSGAGRSLIKLGLNNPITEALKDASGQATTTGGKIAEGILKGIGNSIILGLGPILLATMGSIAKRTFGNVVKDIGQTSGLIGKSERQFSIQEKIVSAYQRGDSALKQQLATMTLLTEKANELNSVVSVGLGGAGGRVRSLSTINGLGNITPESIGGLTAADSPLISSLLSGGVLNNLQVYSLRKKILGNVASELNPNVVFPNSGSLNGIKKSLDLSVRSRLAPERDALRENLINSHPGLPTGGALVPLSLLAGTPIAQQELARIDSTVDSLMEHAIQEEVKSKLKEIESQVTIHLGNIAGRSKFNNYSRIQDSLVQQQREEIGITGYRSVNALRNRDRGFSSVFGTTAGDVAALEAEFGVGLSQFSNVQRTVSQVPIDALASRRSMLRQKIGFGVAVAAPLLAGFVPERSGGTASGLVLGGTSGALNGAGLGAGVGSLFSPIGGLIGAGAGGILGGAYGAISKINKSFEELAKEIEDSNNKNSEQINAATNAFNIANQIREGLENGASRKNIKNLESQFTASVSSIKDPRIRNLLLNNITDPDTLAKIHEYQQTETDAVNSRGGLLSSVGGQERSYSVLNSVIRGGLGALLGGNVGAALGIASVGTAPNKGDVTSAAEGFQGALSKLNPYQLKALQSINSKDPVQAIKLLGKMTGLDDSQLKDLTERSDTFGGISKTLGYLNPIGAFAKKAKEGVDTFLQESLKQGIDQYEKTLSESKSSGVSTQVKDQVERLESLVNLTLDLERKADTVKIQDAALLKLTQARQQIALSRPLTEQGRLNLTQGFEAANIRSEFDTQRNVELYLGRRDLLSSIAKTGDSKANRNKIQGINSLQSAQDLFALLNTDEGRTQFPNLGSKETLKVLADLIEKLRKLDETETSNVEVSQQLLRIQTEDIDYKNSRQGAIDIGTKNRTVLLTELENARSRGDPIASIRQRGLDVDLNNIDLNRRAGLISEQDALNKVAYKTSGINSRNQIESNLAAAYAAKTNKLINGETLQSTLYNVALDKGQQGDALGSLKGGFNSVIEGFKRNADQMADIGKNLADSLSTNLGNAFGDFVTGAKSGKDAFRSFVTSVLNDAARALASKAVQTLLSSLIGGFTGGSSGGMIGSASGGVISMASGGRVPALLMGGEYLIGPRAAKRIGYDTLAKLNSYADGGMVHGGSGYKDDVPANLPSGSYVIRKSAVRKLGPDYLHALTNGQVQHRDIGGILIGALLGGTVGAGVGYATGGKKGALIGGAVGAIAGGFYGNSVEAKYNSLSDVGKATAGSAYLGEGAGAAATTLSATQKALLGLGAAGALGLAARATAGSVGDSGPGPISNSQVSAYKSNLEATQLAYLASAGSGKYPYLQLNPQGGYSLAGFGDAPATRRFADGGPVDSPMISGGANSGGATQVNIKIEINNNGSTKSSASSNSGNGAFGEEFAEKLNKQVRAIVNEELVRQSRSDGFFARKNPLATRNQ